MLLKYLFPNWTFLCFGESKLLTNNSTLCRDKLLPCYLFREILKLTGEPNFSFIFLKRKWRCQELLQPIKLIINFSGHCLSLIPRIHKDRDLLKTDPLPLLRTRVSNCFLKLWDGCQVLGVVSESETVARWTPRSLDR